jgi:hypothetical protein
MNKGKKEAEIPGWDPGPVVDGGLCSTDLSATRRPEADGVAPLEGFLIRGAKMHVQVELAKARQGLRVGAHLRAHRDLFPVGGASLGCVCLPLSPAGSGPSPHRFITPSRIGAKRAHFAAECQRFLPFRRHQPTL